MGTGLATSNGYSFTLDAVRHLLEEPVAKPSSQLIGGKILTASDLEAMNAAEVQSRKIPLS